MQPAATRVGDRGSNHPRDGVDERGVDVVRQVARQRVCSIQHVRDALRVGVQYLEPDQVRMEARRVRGFVLQDTDTPPAPI